jgi:Flp pilus assembly protein TadG
MVSGVKSESGSATLEFVVLVIPLFIPLAIFIGNFAHSVIGHLDIQNLAGQMVKSFVTSPNDLAARANVDSLNREFAVRVLHGDGISNLPTYKIECESTPCITSDSAVVVTVNLNLPQGQSSASAVGIVDPWR